MKIQNLIVLIVITLTLSSCGSTMIVKRKHRAGFYVQLFDKQNNTTNEKGVQREKHFKNRVTFVASSAQPNITKVNSVEHERSIHSSQAEQKFEKIQVTKYPRAMGQSGISDQQFKFKQFKSSKIDVEEASSVSKRATWKTILEFAIKLVICSVAALILFFGLTYLLYGFFYLLNPAGNVGFIVPKNLGYAIYTSFVVSIVGIAVFLIRYFKKYRKWRIIK